MDNYIENGKMWHKSNVLYEWQCQALLKGAILCFRNPYFYFRHGESTSIVSQQTYAASQLSKDLNNIPLLLQNLAKYRYETYSLVKGKVYYPLSNQ